MALAARTHDPGADLSDRFSDVHVLRAGSQFTVYDALEDATRRRVAIKVPYANRTSWLCDVLRAEGRVLAAVGDHPNIVTLLQSFDLRDGRPALMLERCVGSLSDHLATDARVSLQEAVAIGIKLAGALETVHAAGVLHCDVRPDNVLVSEYGEPVLAGFDEAVIDTSTASRPRSTSRPRTPLRSYSRARSPRPEPTCTGSARPSTNSSRAGRRSASTPASRRPPLSSGCSADG